MSDETATETLTTQPETTTEAATTDDLAAKPAEEQKSDEREPKPEEPRGTAAERFARAAAAQKAARAARREAEDLRKQIAAERAEVQRLREAAQAQLAELEEIRKSPAKITKKLGIKTEDALNDLLSNGEASPDPVTETRQELAELKAQIRKQEEERAELEKKAKEEQATKQVYAMADQFVTYATDEAKFPYIKHMFTPTEVGQRAIQAHNEAEEAGKTITFEQVANWLEGYAKEQYLKQRERLKALDAISEKSLNGHSEKRPVNTLTNGDAAQSAASSGRPKSRKEVLAETTAWLEAQSSRK